jgi:shikimate dehydrogenase
LTSTRWFAGSAADRPYFCVVGSPIGHSKSPQIHQAFAAQFAIELIYEQVEVRQGELAAALTEFRAIGGRGMNVTVPLKEEAWGLAIQRTPRAAAAGAANTLWFDDHGTLSADNTDGVGLVRDLVANHDVALAGRHVLLLGAGGAARGVLPALLEAAPALITISNRTLSKAEVLAALATPGVPVEVLRWGAPLRVPADIVINATALSLHGEVPPLAPAAISAQTVCYDMMYGAAAAAFVAMAKARGARVALDGLGMLVEQAAEAFTRWHGRSPATRPVIEALRAGA